MIMKLQQETYPGKEITHVSIIPQVTSTACIISNGCLGLIAKHTYKKYNNSHVG